ncbi:hypothetical protein BDY24DRAFT_398066 [Mrakia frigida]|uniref:uncharacterized protein n=1 Tax=Mrakia frigida TaxID=29902 RepID=UPI003FCC26D9
MLAQSMLGSAFPAGAGGKDRMSQWRESIAPFASDPEGIERSGGNGSSESSPAKQFMEEVLSDPKGSMGGWKFPTTPEKEETRVVEVVGWEEKGEKSRPAEEEDEFEFERTTTTSISDLPRTSLGTGPFPSPLNWTPQGYSSTPNLSLVLIESNDASSSGLYEPSSLASPLSLLSPTSIYTSPHTPSFPSSSNSSDDDGTRTPRQRLASAPPQQTSFARGRSPPSAKSKLHRITTFFDKPVKVVPEAAPRKGLGNSIVVMTPVEMARRMRELEEDEDQEASKRMESFYM